MSEITTAVVLASGLGTRLKTLALKVPKPLIKVGSKFLIEYTLENLEKAGVKRTIITVRPLGGQFLKSLGSAYKSVRLVYKHFPSDSAPLGAAGDLKAVEDLLPKTEDFFVCNSDIMTNLDFVKIRESHQVGRCPATIALVKKNSGDYPASIGLDESGGISRLSRNIYGESYREYTFACQHILSKDLLKFIPKGKPWGFFGDNDLYPTLVEKGIPINTFVYPSGVFWEDVGTPERLKKVGSVNFKINEPLRGSVDEKP